MTNILDYFPEGYTPRDTQIKVLKEIEAKWDLSDVLVLDMDTGCHRKGTEVIMYDGSLKKVEDVKVGDKLMGPDSAPRTVKKLCRGKETMYQINPVKGDSWVVNENHILSLEETPNQRRKKLTHNITVKEFLSLSKSKRRNLKLYRRGVDWENETDTTIDPYLLGVWLGDGSSGAPVFTLSSPFLVNYVVKQVCPETQDVALRKKNGCVEVRVTGKGKGNPIRKDLSSLGVLDNKHIPKEYLLGSKDTRLSLLAGLLDTDGYLGHSGFEIITKFDRLSEDILFLARSLGLAAYHSDKLVKLKDWDKPKRYNRISISGDCSAIPTMVKVSEKRKQKKSVLRTGFTVERLGDEDYFGFSLDKDHLYLLKDFTVTHNSGKSHVLQTVARWRSALKESSATLTPRVSLQQQYKKSFPDVVVLQGKGRYKCKDTLFKNCLEKKEVTGDYCSGCKYSCDRNKAMESRNGVYSVHSYLMLRSRKDNLLVDEAHTLYDIMSEQNTIKLWQHKVKYPNNMKEYGDVIIWLEKAIKLYEEEETVLNDQIENLKAGGAKHAEMIAWVTGLKEVEQTIKKYKRVLKGIRHSPTDYFIEHILEPYRGKPKKALQIRPTTLEGSMGWLWPKPGTKKVVLASGTISEHDIKKLGLDGLRVNWVHAPQAISNECRPIVFEFAGNMSYKYQDKSLPAVADKILEIQQRHSDTKGMVHTTYALAEKLKKRLGGRPDIIWHTKTDKEDALQRFRMAPPGTLFIGCGMSTGLDLAGSEYGYQILTKVPWPSKADKLISYWYDTDMGWVSWMAAREIMQACGRVNRYDGDYATTYVIDNMFGNPKRNRRGFLTQFKKHFPKHFMERIK